MFKKKYVVTTLSLTVISVLIGSLFYYNMVQAQTPWEYDPWCDINDDGKINIRDIADVASRFSTSGDPTKNVTVTNFPLDEEGNLKISMQNQCMLPIASNHLTVILNITVENAPENPVILSTVKELSGMGGKNITFIGGDVSGGATWSCLWTGSQGVAGYAGSSLPIGRVEVYDPTSSLLAQFALPTKTMFTVANVNRITIYAETMIPRLTNDRGYAACIVASVYWIEQ